MYKREKYLVSLEMHIRSNIRKQIFQRQYGQIKLKIKLMNAWKEEIVDHCSRPVWEKPSKTLSQRKKAGHGGTHLKFQLLERQR
jgi:hypothetical protein